MTVANAAVTPMMAQFLEIKEVHRDALLFYRMGDFYEMFFDDAIAAAEALDIALTKRGKHLGEDIPMCGVPVHSAEGYLLTLIRKGFRVAVCEQLEDPAEAKKRGSKAVVKRGVVRLVTPGTLTEDALLDARSNNFLAAMSIVRDDCALAWVDISTGEFRVSACQQEKLSPELARLAPREVLVSDTMEPSFGELVTDFGISLTQLPPSAFDSSNSNDRLAKYFEVDSLDAFGPFSRAEISAMGALLSYLELTQVGRMPKLSSPRRVNPAKLVQIDPATRRNLELTRSLSGGKDGSLLRVIDRTATAAGARLLERRLSAPSSDLAEIHARLDAVGYFVADSQKRADLREELRRVPDIDRALSRLGLERGGPRDIAAVRDGLAQAECISSSFSDDLPERLKARLRDLEGFSELVELLEDALVAEPPLLARDGGFIAPGYDADLDEARQLRDEGRGVIANLQKTYADVASVSSLKIKHNNVLGYFIETPATHAEKMLSAPLSDTFIHRQTTANAVRFTTVELSEMETKILNAGQRALEVEKRLYSSLSGRILDQGDRISLAASAIAEIDFSSALGEVAASLDWVLPNVDDSRDFDIKGGRHPVVEDAISRQSGAVFVANDCNLSAGDDAAAIWLVTGPNMAGKSTYLRQNCLIALLAQIGSFVPAGEARIGVVSQIFSRVGASDDLARGRSTFMVEMVETAAILNQADDRALVILDEIGRGTATYDGLSIAWATLEHLHGVNKCRALFATHYHELTHLADNLGGVGNATVKVKEWDGEIIFLHEVRQGAADQSYGVQVAKLAGLPLSVISRARSVLERLEAGEREGGAAPGDIFDDLPLFSASADTVPTPGDSDRHSELVEMIKGSNPDGMTPLEALSLIYDLRKLVGDA